MIGWEFPPHMVVDWVSLARLDPRIAEISQPVVFALPRVLPHGGGSIRKTVYQHQVRPRHGDDLVNSQLQPYWRQPGPVPDSVAVDMVQESKRYGDVVANVARSTNRPPRCSTPMTG